ncbi:cardiolipin synthase [Alkaliphilus crotonatoxidans]
MVNLYKYGFMLFFAMIFFLNLFLFISHGLMIGIYPYVAAMTVILGIAWLLHRLLEGMYYLNMIDVFMITLILFFTFTLFQIWKNTRLANGYQNDRSQYMDQLMELGRGAPSQRTFSQPEQGLINLIEANTGIPVTDHNQVTLFNGGKSIIDEMIEAIDKAEHHVHIEFFIVRDDQIGNKFKDILIEKAREGVEVRFLYDGLGSGHLGKNYVRSLRDAGVHVYSYDGIIASLLKGKLNHRNHRKILIVDGKVGFVGGFNIGDEYLGRDQAVGNWKDLHIKIEGEAIKGLQQIFLGDWHYVTKEKLLDTAYFPPVETKDEVAVQMVTSGFDTHWNEISQVYFSMIATAQEKIYIATPYLILNDSMLKALQTAALRGVDVRIIIPHKPDLFLVGWVNESFFQKLLKAKVKIYLYDEGFLHAKVLLKDNRIASVGSANLNTRSLFLDYEVNGVIYDRQTCDAINREFEDYLKNSTEVTYDEFKQITVVQRIKYLIGRLIIPFA